MKKYFVYLLLVIVLGYAIFRLLFPASHQSNTGAVTVSVSHAVQQSVAVKAQTLGTVEAYASVEVKSMVSGPLVRVGFREGDVVQRGQILFEIDPRPFEAALSQAEANLARDQATLKRDNAVQERHSSLVKKGFTSQQDYDTIVATAKATAATVMADEAAVENAQLQLDYATIKAPFTGVTGSITLKIGSVIKANDTIPLVLINQVSPIYVSFTLPQNNLPSIQSALSERDLAVTATIQEKTEETGKLVFVDNQVDVATGTIKLKAQFDNLNRQLWPGQHVTVEMTTEQREQAILIPSLALVTSQKGFYVYVVDDQGYAHRKDVVPGPAIGDKTIIEKGLSVNERVVIAGQMRIQDGSKVDVSQK